jgi:hypothetical protein
MHLSTKPVFHLPWLQFVDYFLEEHAAAIDRGSDSPIMNTASNLFQDPSGLGSICHDPSIEVETQPGEFTEIKIVLPRAGALP